MAGSLPLASSSIRRTPDPTVKGFAGGFSGRIAKDKRPKPGWEKVEPVTPEIDKPIQLQSSRTTLTANGDDAITGDKEIMKENNKDINVETLTLLIFRKESLDSGQVMFPESIRILPPKVLAALIRMGKTEGTVLSITMSDIWYKHMLRLKQWVENKHYTRPSQQQLLYIDAMGETSVWDPAVQPNSIAVSITDTTDHAFRVELDFYNFAVEINHEKLIQAAIDNLVDNFPKSTDLIFELATEYYPRIALHQNQRKLSKHILELLHNNQNVLKAEDLSKYQKLVDYDPSNLGSAMYHHLCHDLPVAVPQPLICTNKLRKQDEFEFINALRNSVYVTALDHGNDVLHRLRSAGGNKEFRHVSGELLLTTINHRLVEDDGNKHYVVFNSQGIKGSIKAKLLSLPFDIKRIPGKFALNCSSHSQFVHTPSYNTTIYPHNNTKLNKSRSKLTNLPYRSVCPFRAFVTSFIFRSQP
jgi:hypothetical protein